MAALTTANGVNATKRAAIIAGTAGVASFIDGANEWGTKLRICYDTYEMPATDTMAVGGVITVGAVPKGARILGFYCANEAFGAAVTADFQVVDSAGTITQVTGAEVWTSWNAADEHFWPALEAVSNTPRTTNSTITITIAGAGLVISKSIVVATLYIVED